MVSPMNSRRTGRRSPAGKMSATPPRIENSPCWSTGSSRVNPARTRMSASSIGSMSSPGLSSSEAATSVPGSGSRGSSAAADATTMRAWPVARPCRARARADATSKCGSRPRYGSTSGDGNGRTPRSSAAPLSPSRLPRKKRASLTNASMSLSAGTMTTAGACCAAAATARAFAAGVRPDRRVAAAASPVVEAASLSRKRRERDEPEVPDIVRRSARLFRIQDGTQEPAGPGTRVRVPVRSAGCEPATGPGRRRPAGDSVRRGPGGQDRDRS